MAGSNRELHAIEDNYVLLTISRDIGIVDHSDSNIIGVDSECAIGCESSYTVANSR